eukprot:gene11407-21605_t
MGWDGLGWEGIGWDGMGWDGMGWEGKGRDGIGWDGMGWDGMGWDGMGWDGIFTISYFLETLIPRVGAQGERAVKQEFPEATILRPAECYGHEDKFLNMYAYLRNLPFGQPLIDNGMETKKRPVLVADVAQAIVNAALDESAAGKTYELYGPEEYYLHDIVEYVYKIIRKPFRPYKIPENIYKMVAYFLEQSIFDPRMTRDKVTRHYLSDQISSHIMSFEDLGIKPATINEAAISMLRRHRDMMHYDDSHTEDEFCKPTSAYN